MTTAANCNGTKKRKAIRLPPGSKLAYNVDEAAAALGMSDSTVWLMIKEGFVAAKKVRGRTLIAREELQRIVDEAPSVRNS